MEEDFNAGAAHLSPDGTILLFWKPPCCFSQWTESPFKVDGQTYTCAEQYMMAEKAKLFGDEETRQRILETSYDPWRYKKLGRQVKNFVWETWRARCMDIVVDANMNKFQQNKRMLRELLATTDKILAEASPRDKVWGIGLRADDPRAFNQVTWEGENLLGQALMTARDQLRSVQW